MAVIHDHANTPAIQKAITLQLLPEPLATPTKPAGRRVQCRSSTRPDGLVFGDKVAAEHGAATDQGGEAERGAQDVQQTMPADRVGVRRVPGGKPNAGSATNRPAPSRPGRSRPARAVPRCDPDPYEYLGVLRGALAECRRRRRAVAPCTKARHAT